MVKISKEQTQILKSLKIGNVVVDAVAGSGKTTTNIFIAKAFPDANILLLTYNSKLKIETRSKVKRNGIENMEVHSYHSFCCEYYDKGCHTDYKLIEMLELKQDLQIDGLTDSDDDFDDDFVHEVKESIVIEEIEAEPRQHRLKGFNYDIIILDEAQDITDLYYKVIHKIIKDNDNEKMKLCLLGDKKQNIYRYAGADDRYMEYASKMFSVNKYPWIDVKLTVSFRVTHQIAGFLNNCLLDYDRVKAAKNGKKVRYVICNNYGFKQKKHWINHVYDEIKYYLNLVKDGKKRYSPSDIFILTPSVKSKYIQQLANTLSYNRINIFVPGKDDDSVIDNDILKNKLIFSSFHQSKGLERPIVIVLNFDNTYNKYYNKTAPTKTCPNELYVAVTRSSDRLSIIHHYRHNYIPCLHQDKLSKYVNIIIKKKLNIKDEKVPYSRESNCLAVSKLVDYVSAYVIKKSLNYIKYEYVKVNDDSYGEIFIIPKSKQEEDIHESVSDITGTAIPAYYEYINTKQMNIFNILNKLNKKEQSKPEYKRKIFTKFTDLNNLTVNKLLKISLEWIVYRSKMIYRKNQIKDFNWLNGLTLKKCIMRMRRFVSKNAMYECQINISGQKELHGENISGYIDCIDGNKIWEFKCTSRIKEEHIIQMAIYIYLLNKKERNNEKMRFYIFNILSGKIITIHNNESELEKLVDYLVQNKQQKNTRISDTEFLEKNLITCD